MTAVPGRARPGSAVLRRLPARALLAFGLFACAGPAGAESLVTSISTSQVTIGSNYTGGAVVLFGAIERDGQSIARATGYDVVVTVRGPRHSFVVRQKEPLGPIWINQAQQKFVNLPAFIGVFSSRPLSEITTDVLRQRFRVGIEAIVRAPDVSLDRGRTQDPFREALLRLRLQERLFVENERGVTFLTPSIFRAAIPLPATAPTGNYEVEATLFADGVVLARTDTNFELVKTGFEQRMADVARDWSALYGLGTALAALAFGWLANVIFRRD